MIFLYYVSPHFSPPIHLIRPGWWLLASLLLLPVIGWADEFRIDKLEGRLVDETYVVDAVIDYQFSEQVLEALQNGVPLTLEAHFQVRREGAWIWGGDLMDVRLRYRIRFQAFASLYLVEDLQSGGEQRFVSREAAISALGDLHGLTLIAEDRLREGEHYRLKLRASLDIDALPLPLRPWAYLSPAWRLSSKKRSWRFQP